MMIYILHQEDKVPIRIQSKKSCLRHIFFDKFCLRRSLFTQKSCLQQFLQNLVHGPFHISAFFGLPIHWYSKRFESKNLVITTTLFVKNINEESVKWQILCQIKPREIQIAQHQFNSKTVKSKSTYVITRNNNITTIRLVFICLRFHAVSSRLLLSPWHSNDPEPTIYLFLLESGPQFCPASCPWWLPTSSTHYIPPTITYAQSLA